MAREFVHYFILLLIIFSFGYVLLSLKKYCPKKLKKYALISTILGILSYSAQFYISLAKAQNHINYLKPLIFMSSLVDVLLILINFYIFLRRENLKFKWTYFYMTIMSIVFIISMYFLDSMVKIDKVYGFKLILVNDFIYRIAFIGILVVLAIAMIILIDYKYSLKIPWILLLLSTLGMIGENILYLANISVFPYPIISDLAIYTLFIYAMYRTRKIN